MSIKEEKVKVQYLSSLFKNIYLKDILERHSVRNTLLLEQLLEVISSSTRSLINPPKIRQIFKSRLNTEISEDSISMFLSWLEDAFLIYSSKRFDIKGRKYIGSPFKYYLLDCGLRNVMLNFRQNKENHIMENIIFNELLI